MAGDEVRRLTTPLSDEIISSLHAGDRVCLSGVILTGRDAAHKRLVDLLDKGQAAPGRCAWADYLLRWAHTAASGHGDRLGRADDWRADGFVRAKADGTRS